MITHLLFAAILFTVVTASAHADPSSVFFRKFCIDCHDDVSNTAGLSLESLTPEYVDRDLHRTWVRVFDQVADGKMPPRDESQPTAAERKAFLAQLRGKLHAASLKQQQHGRVEIRRLSRVEYENTLHDLLGVGIELQSLLPEDNLVAGFDNMSAGLETSATHLVQYQEAAEQALEEFLPARINAKKSTVVRTTGRQWLEAKPKIYHNKIVPWSRIEGDSFIYRANLDHHASPRTDYAKYAGRYRIRASVRALNNNGKAIPIEFGRIKTDRFGRQDLEHLVGIQDAVEGESHIIVAEGFLTARDSVYLAPRSFPYFSQWPKDRPKPDSPEFSGPELRLEWLEIEGPLESSDAYETFFGGLKRVPDRYLEAYKTGGKYPDWTKWNPNEFAKPHNRLRFVTDEPQADADRLISLFLERAIRRPPSAELLRNYQDRAHAMLNDGMLLDEVLLRVYKEILCSAHFLLRIEKPGKLDDYALASRLSYMLWNSMPDQALLAAAEQGELHKPEVLRAQTERMLKDAKSERFVDHFTGKWLNLHEIHDMKPDRIYREYDESLAWSMPLETRLFFKEVLKRNLPVTDFVDSDWTLLNDRLAAHYGINGVDGMNLRVTKLPADAHRGGIITHASILKLTTNASYTSPIKRGAWVLDRILGTPPAPPPANVEAIEPDIRGAVTLREQMKLHKSQAVCASCHKSIDPPGFALENFDVLGGWRERYRVAKGGEGINYLPLPNYPDSGYKSYFAKTVDAHGEMESGEAFANIDQYKEIILRDPDQIARNLAQKLLTYGTGGVIEFADRKAVEEIVAASRADGYGFRSLLHAVVQSSVFQKK